MEKRLLISIALSFFVLYLWSIFHPPQQKSDGFDKIQKNVDKYDPRKSVLHQKVSTDEIVEEPLSSPPQSLSLEKNQTFQSDFLSFDVSSRGASISNVLIKKYNEALPMEQIFNLDGFVNKNFEFISADNNTYIYSFSDSTYKIDKVIKISGDDFTFSVDYIIENLTELSKDIDLNITPFILDMSKVNINSKDISKDRSLFEYVIYTEKKTYRKNNAFKFNGKDEKVIDGYLNWIGFRNRYYAGIIKPLFKVNNISTEALSDQQLKIEINTENLLIPPKGQIVLSAFIYFGPEDMNKLKDYGFAFENMKRFYKFTLFDAIAKIIYEILHWIHGLIPNWGVSIILISVIIYGSMYPLTLRSMTSMKKMQEVQPKIMALKIKYKDNPQKMNKELMEIYKENKINPLGGCIPILFQMPVFIGLYQVLWRDVSFKGANFLWISDLSQPDKFFKLPMTLPFIGEYINFLPFLMMGIMFIQAKLQAKNMAMTTPEQQDQQKMMSSIMPFFLGFIFYHFASGLTLYFTIFYMFSTASQWYISLQKSQG